MNLAVGSLVLLGFMAIVFGIISKFAGVSPLSPLVVSPPSYLLIANSCFLLALIVDRFGKKG